MLAEGRTRQERHQPLSPAPFVGHNVAMRSHRIAPLPTAIVTMTAHSLWWGHAGGSRNTSRSVLAALGALAEAERAFEGARAAFEAADGKLQGMAGAARTFQK